jgi:hypothetical protein
MRMYRASLLASGLLFGCGGGEQNCSVVGCGNTLTINLTVPPAGAYRVEVIGPGETAPHGQDCTGTGPCPIAFRNYQPTTVTVSVITANGTTTYSKTPTYVTSFPNGEACGPACQAALVTVP